jgi:hypothetical protein
MLALLTLLLVGTDMVPVGLCPVTGRAQDLSLRNPDNPDLRRPVHDAHGTLTRNL